jgi:hypothetical protein
MWSFVFKWPFLGLIQQNLPIYYVISLFRNSYLSKSSNVALRGLTENNIICTAPTEILLNVSVLKRQTWTMFTCKMSFSYKLARKDATTHPMTAYVGSGGMTPLTSAPDAG